MKQVVQVINVGFHRHVVTPPVGVELTGYGGRIAPSVGVLDDLIVDAIAFRPNDGQPGVIWINADILSFGAEHVQHIRERIEQTLGVPGERVALCASHTHSGPEVATTHLGVADVEYLRMLERWVVSAASIAWRCTSPAELRIGCGSCNIAQNRRQPDGGPTDPQVLTLQWTGGQPGAIVMFTCHCVVLSPGNYRFSADYCGVTRRTMEHVLSETRSSLGTGTANHPVSFTNGCAGDINPRGGPRDEMLVPYGRMLAFEALKAMEEAKPIRAVPVEGVSAHVELPVVDPPSLEDCRAEVAKREAEWQTSPEGYQRKMAGIFLRWAKERLRQVETGTYPRSQTAEVQAFRIGDFGVVFLPGEPLVRLGLRIKEGSPAPYTWVAGYSNGTVGYVADEESWQQRGYEVEIAPQFYDMGPYKAEAGQILVECGLKLLRRLFPH